MFQAENRTLDFWLGNFRLLPTEPFSWENSYENCSDNEKFKNKAFFLSHLISSSTQLRKLPDSSYSCLIKVRAFVSVKKSPRSSSLNMEKKMSSNVLPRAPRAVRTRTSLSSSSSHRSDSAFVKLTIMVRARARVMKNHQSFILNSATRGNKNKNVKFQFFF